MICPGCAAEIDEGALSCPRCLRLLHSAELADLAARATAAWHAGKFAEERALWEDSLKLLPSNTVQYKKIEARLGELHEQEAAAKGAAGDGLRRASAGLGPALLLALTKGKALLLGFTKIGTLLTMVASFGVYWTMYGWAFAAGLVVSIYIHEMGHVAALRRYGFPATAPMFIPGLGAFIRLRGVRVPPVLDCRIGLAGPLYGLGAAVVSLCLYYATGVRIWAAIAHFGAIVNLFNLIPLWSLDGSRGMHSQTRVQRLWLVGLTAFLWVLTSNPILFLIAAVSAYRLFTRDWRNQPDNAGMATFAGLLAALALVAWLSPLK
jgi:Zn-dependent protease